MYDGWYKEGGEGGGTDGGRCISFGKKLLDMIESPFEFFGRRFMRQSNITLYIDSNCRPKDRKERGRIYIYVCVYVCVFLKECQKKAEEEGFANNAIPRHGMCWCHILGYSL